MDGMRWVGTGEEGGKEGRRGGGRERGGEGGGRVSVPTDCVGGNVLTPPPAATGFSSAS